MALKINLKPKERIIIGEAVISNGNRQTCSLIIENKVPVLRQKDILKEDNANTLGQKIYFTIQLMYIDNDNLVEYHEIYWKLVKNIIKTVPEVLKLIDNISENIVGCDYYQALKSAKQLVNYETEVLNYEKQPLECI
jgi:flagellar protein FlbT